MIRIPDMFPALPRPRRRALLHIDDAGPDCMRLKCRTCGYDTDWIVISVAEVRKGVECPVCNVLPSSSLSGDNK
jgi:hypothetical protein